MASTSIVVIGTGNTPRHPLPIKNTTLAHTSGIPSILSPIKSHPHGPPSLPLSASSPNPRPIEFCSMSYVHECGHFAIPVTTSTALTTMAIPVT